jgi:hypothetical protein
MIRRVTGTICLLAAAALAQDTGKLIVTAEPKGHEQATIQRDDITVEIDKKPARVLSWTPLRGAPLQLYIVIDDAESTDLSLQYPDLKNFINAQPASTQIGLAYLRYGSAELVQQLTSDHASVANALRMPLEQVGIDASPYIAIEDLIKKWTPGDARREVLLISSGIDPYYLTPDLADPYLVQALDAAERGGVVVSTVYFPNAGHFGHSFFRATWGQNYLSMLSERTGGEFYWQGATAPVSIQPFLNQFAEWLNNQYMLSVQADYSGKPELKPIKVTTRFGISMVSASRVYLQGSGATGPRS